MSESRIQISHPLPEMTRDMFVAVWEHPPKGTVDLRLTDPSLHFGSSVNVQEIVSNTSSE